MVITFLAGLGFFLYASCTSMSIFGSIEREVQFLYASNILYFVAVAIRWWELGLNNLRAKFLNEFVPSVCCVQGDISILG